MTDKTALRQLIEAIEAGTFAVDDAPALSLEMSGIVCAALGDELWSAASDAFDGSLDAAKALHEALLPGWALERLNMWPGENGTCSAILWGTHEEKGKRWHNHKDGRVSSESSNPARAWLIAILKAYEAQQ